MNNLSKTILQISGRNNKSCYDELECAVAVTMEVLPQRPMMKYIQLEVRRRMELPIKASSVGRLLSRAAEDIWIYGDRRKLESIFRRPLLEQPSAKSMIITIAKHVKDLDESSAQLNATNEALSRR